MMKHTPIALSEAKLLCAELQSLVGQVFDPALPEMGNIECVAVAPFDLQNKKLFLLYYLLCDDAENALQEYRGLLYDIVVIARSSEITTDLMQYDIYTWLEKNNLTLNDIRRTLTTAEQYGT